MSTYTSRWMHLYCDHDWLGSVKQDETTPSDWLKKFSSYDNGLSHCNKIIPTWKACTKALAFPFNYLSNSVTL